VSTHNFSPGDLVCIIYGSAAPKPYLVIDAWISFGQPRCTIITSRGPVSLWASELFRVEAP
jgi:hypothetical protein